MHQSIHRSSFMAVAAPLAQIRHLLEAAGRRHDGHAETRQLDLVHGAPVAALVDGHQTRRLVQSAYDAAEAVAALELAADEDDEGSRFAAVNALALEDVAFV